MIRKTYKGWRRTDLADRQLVQHVPRPLYSKELASDPYDVLTLTHSRCRCGIRNDIRTDQGLQGRGKVNVCRGLLLNALKDVSLSTCDDRMELLVDLAHFGMKTALRALIRQKEVKRKSKGYDGRVRLA